MRRGLRGRAAEGEGVGGFKKGLRQRLLAVAKRSRDGVRVPGWRLRSRAAEGKVSRAAAKRLLAVGERVE